MADRDLAAQAPVIARVKVVDVAPGPAHRSPATDYLVEVDELVQGALPGGTIVVRVPGGTRADGLTMRIAGAPELATGEQALLFLAPGEDGTYGIVQLMLGAFHARRLAGREVAEQDLAGAQQLGPVPAGDATAVRDLDRFTGWLADRAAGIERAPDYWRKRPTGAPAPGEKAYSTLTTGDGVPARWFAFEAGSVSWRVHSAGQPGVDPGQTVAAFQAALDAWSSDPTSTIRYSYAGTTDAATGYGAPDTVNAVLFDDPHGQVPGSFDCKKGGVLAFAGPYFYADVQTYRGSGYHSIVEADIVTNDGSSCFFAGNPQGTAEVFTHELGHTLGFGHASDPRAVMYAITHNDGRGALLGDDDRVGASVVYGDGSYQPAVAPPSTALALTASAARTTIDLAWNQLPGNVDCFRIEKQVKKGFQLLQTLDGAALETTVTGLKPNQSVALRVTAMRGGAIVGTSDLVRVRTSR